MRHRPKNSYVFFFLVSALLAVLAACGGSHETSTLSVTSLPVTGWVQVDPVSTSPLTSSIVLSGSAWVSNNYVGLHCSGFACLFDTSTDNYPGVDVTCVNLTTGTAGAVTSYYGGGTGWNHRWTAAVPLVAGKNTIQVSAHDPSGAGASTTVEVYGNPLESIMITPADPTIPKGMTRQLAATGILADASTLDLTGQVTWTSSDTSKATINASGAATGLAVGSSTITATLLGMSGSTILTISSAAVVSIAVSPTDSTLPAGSFVQFPFTASGTFTDGTIQDITATVTWSSSDTGVALISNDPGSNGKVTAMDNGTATITAASGAISTSAMLTVKTLASISIPPAEVRMLRGGTREMWATGRFGDGTEMAITSLATWNSSDPAVATISNAPGSQGKVTAVSGGTTTVSASWGAIFGSAAVTVSSWTPQPSGTTEPLFDVTWNGTQLVAVRSVGINVVSSDGITWSQRSFDLFLVNTLYGACSCGARFAAVGNYVFLTSPDGASFTTMQIPGTELYGVTCSDDKFVAVGSAGAIITSSDGFVSSGTTNQLYGITWTGTMFVAVGASGIVLTSPDGVAWTSVQASDQALRDIVWSGTQFVAVGNGGTVATSPDGVTWTSRTSGTTNVLFDVAWSGTRFVAVGSKITILTSPDGVTWAAETLDVTNNNLYAVTWAGTKFVAVGDNGMILTLP